MRQVYQRLDEASRRVIIPAWVIRVSNISIVVPIFKSQQLLTVFYCIYCPLSWSWAGDVGYPGDHSEHYTDRQYYPAGTYHVQ
ncbi:hypothetical protein B9Q03_13980 [Candidatus Marsarchaeota G2 archaeon OSP_D]|uniref:Uncharacterized protein n=1 Tax=Candidatus Marsarchaeota G2 archaeon OSP_D TaxID=1978157 RepID=A0A2R6A8G8_9ARCH|nr:MAG: hypothetical protein B9Q03_13980 [Candidatus Marsarchaeota G2 archaeon OSP_D]